MRDVTQHSAAQRVRLRAVSELLASRAWRTWQRDWLVACARARQERNGTGVARGWAPRSTPAPKSSGQHLPPASRAAPTPEIALTSPSGDAKGIRIDDAHD